jgi:TonB family protein
MGMIRASGDARPIVDWIGWKRAKGLYAALGFAFVGIGILVATGILRLPERGEVHVRNMASGVRLKSGEIRRVLKSVAPEYPAALRQKGVCGKVIVRVYVAADGPVAGTQIRSSPTDDLSVIAISAIKEWVFEPAKDAAMMTVEVPVEFSVD